MSHRRIPVILVFLVGSIAGGIGAQLAAPLVHAQAAPAPAPLARWEHYCQAYTAEAAKIAGERGWEMVGVFVQTQTSTEMGSTITGRSNEQTTYYSTVTACYKRPLVAAK